MYDIDGYGRMIADKMRTDAYVATLRSVVRPDSVVLDLGTGTGIFALSLVNLAHRKFMLSNRMKLFRWPDDRGA